MVDALGLSYAMDQNVAVHTNGAATATNINGAGQTGSTITVIAVAGGTLAAGTVITLPGVFAVNPQSRVSTGVLADFVVTADVSAAATSIPISPAIVTSGPYQNVTASPTTAQPYVIKGAASTSYGCNLGFHEDAFTLAMVPMATPPDGTAREWSKSRTTATRSRSLIFMTGPMTTLLHGSMCCSGGRRRIRSLPSSITRSNGGH